LLFFEAVSKVNFFTLPQGSQRWLLSEVEVKTQKAQSINNQIFTFALFAVKIPFKTALFVEKMFRQICFPALTIFYQPKINKI